jgi:hypothetical protein
MPPTPQALDFVFTQILSPDQLEEYICSFWPEGIQLVHLRAALSAPPFGSMNYAELLAAVAKRLVMAGHQRSPMLALQELGFLPSPGPLPPIQVRIRSLEECSLTFSLKHLERFPPFSWLREQYLYLSPGCPFLVDYPDYVSFSSSSCGGVMPRRTSR